MTAEPAWPTEVTDEAQSHREREMAALDALPRDWRYLIYFGPYRTHAVDITNALVRRTENQVETLIRKVWRGTPTVRADAWKKWNPLPYPHFAANATFMHTRPIEPANDNGNRKRHLARLRAPPPNPVLEPKRGPPPKVIYL